MHQARFFGDIAKRPVAVVTIQMVGRCWSLSEAFQPRPIDQKDVEPVVVVEVKQRNAASRLFEDEFLRRFASDHGLCRYTASVGNVDIVRNSAV